MKNREIFIFFGPPGSGKGTQADLLANNFKIPTISPGELFRHEIDKKSKLGKNIENLVSQGKLLPDKLVEKIVFSKIRKRYVKKGFILDGFPRDINQLKSLEKELARIATKDSLVRAINIRVSGKEVKKRLGGRRVCDCGAEYHLIFNPPKKKGICDDCNKKLYIRADDRPSIIADRLKNYNKNITPLLKYFRRKNSLIIINGDQPISKVHHDIIAKINEIIKK